MSSNTLQAMKLLALDLSDDEKRSFVEWLSGTGITVDSHHVDASPYIKPVTIVFHDSGRIEHQGKKNPLRGYRFGLLKAVYESENWSLTYDEVGATVWGKNYFDIDQVIKTANAVRQLLKNWGIPVHISTANKRIALSKNVYQT